MRAGIVVLLVIAGEMVAVSQRASAEGRGALSPAALRWDGRENPLGLVQFEPRLRWRSSVQSRTPRGARQTAWQVLVANRPDLLKVGKADVWDSGKVISAESINVRYGGPAPQARQRLFWTVRVWDDKDRPSAFAPPAWSEMGLLDEEWEGLWIGRPRDGGPQAANDGGDRSVTYLRKPFSLPREIRQARLYASALGVYEVRLNGKRVGRDVLGPGYTDYVQRVLFQSHDVTALVQGGDNVLGAIVAGGWCTARIDGRAASCGQDPPRIIVQLEVTLANGERRIIVSDETWRARSGPWQSAHLIEGEHYDARHELPGWDRPGQEPRLADDTAMTGWRAAAAYDKKIERNLVADSGPPLQVTEDIVPSAIMEVRPRIYRFDFGQTVVGWPQLSARVPAGTEIRFRYGETASRLGSVQDRYIARYIARGSSSRWEPQFSLKRFRFVEVEGLSTRPTKQTLVGRRVHSLMASTAQVATSARALNQVWTTIDRAQQNAFVSVPTPGAPGGRPGSLAEAGVFAPTACLLRDVQGFYRKWIEDLRSAQLPNAAYPDRAPASSNRDGGPAGVAALLLPHAMHVCYDDRTALDAHLPSMGRWLERIRSAYPDLIWAQPKDASGDPGERVATNATLVATAQLAHAARALGVIARGAGAGAATEAERHEAVAEGARTAFGRRFLSTDGSLTSDTLAAYALALWLDVIPAARRAQVGERLLAALERQGACPTTGIYGTAALLPALTQMGREDRAYKLLLDPSCFAATLDRDSYAAGAVGSWMLETVAGIALDPSAPGGRHFWLRPRPSTEVNEAHGRFDSLYGPVQTQWRQDKDRFRFAVTVPPNASATVVLPFAGPTTEGGKPLERVADLNVLRGEAEGPIVQIGSGHYEFEVRSNTRAQPEPAPVALPAAVSRSERR